MDPAPGAKGSEEEVDLKDLCVVKEPGGVKLVYAPDDGPARSVNGTFGRTSPVPVLRTAIARGLGIPEGDLEKTVGRDLRGMALLSPVPESPPSVQPGRRSRPSPRPPQSLQADVEMWCNFVTRRRGSIEDQRQVVEAMRRALAGHGVDIDAVVRFFVAIGKDPEDLEDPLDEMTSVLAGGAPLWHPRDIERVARASRAVAAILQKLEDHLDVNEMLRALDKTEVSISLYVEEVENLEALEHPAYLEDPNALLADLRQMESELEELTASAASRALER